MTEVELNPALLEQFEPQKFFALWQHVEGYYAFMGFDIAEQVVSFLMVGATEQDAETMLWEDATQNGRGREAYEIHPLTLADAFEAARSRPLPIYYPNGGVSLYIGGLALFDGGPWPSELIPL